MATRNIVPLAASDGGSIGTAILPWTNVYCTNLVPTNDLPVNAGGTAASSFVAYSVVCGGTTTTGSLQSVANVGSANQVLTSNGAGQLPSWAAVPAQAVGKMLCTSLTYNSYPAINMY